MREIASRPKACIRDLLAKSAESSTDDRRQNIQTPALVSEVLLDALAEGHPLEPETHVTQNYPPFRNNLDPDMEQRRWGFPTTGKSVLTEVFGWIKYATRDEADSSLPDQTAEMRLRAMLEQQRNLDVSNAPTNHD
jgi:hypothetical protein